MGEARVRTGAFKKEVSSRAFSDKRTMKCDPGGKGRVFLKDRRKKARKRLDLGDLQEERGRAG